MRIAIPTKGFKGLDDVVSEVVARAPTITIIDISKEKGSYTAVEICKNPALRFTHGSGPIFVNHLVEKGVEMLVGPIIGISVRDLLEESGIKFLKFDAGTKVKDIVEKLLEE
jgi:predicted Fe-Mo cluster-binding NifX family protein